VAIYSIGVGSGSFLVSYAGVDLTDHVKSATVNFEYDELEVTAMGATDHTFQPGLKQTSADIEFFQDFASAKVDATINTYLGSSSGATLVIQTSGTTVSSTNPKYSGVCAPYNYQPIQGEVGTISMTTVSFKPVAGSSIARGTS